jgi:hypothetical protein
MSGLIIGATVATLATAYLLERIGAIVTVVIYPPNGAPIERANMPPTRWSLLIAWLREATRWLVLLGAGAVLLGWALGGCS